MTQEQADALLEEARSDPFDWHWMDLDKLLELSGFAKKTIRDTQGGEATYRYLVEQPGLNVVLYPVERVHSRVTQHVVRIIDRAKERSER